MKELLNSNRTISEARLKMIAFLIAKEKAEYLEYRKLEKDFIYPHKLPKKIKT